MPPIEALRLARPACLVVAGLLLIGCSPSAPVPPYAVGSKFLVNQGTCSGFVG